MKVKDCPDCKKEIERQITNLLEWEVRKKDILVKWLNDAPHVKCSECADFEAVGYRYQKMYCGDCKKEYQLKNNNFLDTEPDKHSTTCSMENTHEIGTKPAKPEMSKGVRNSLIAVFIVLVVGVIIYAIYKLRV